MIIRIIQTIGRNVLLSALLLSALGLRAESIDDIRQKAEQGDAKAQVVLGDCYLTGTGVDNNTAEAVKWYIKSAGQGYAEAQQNLGELYYYGIGVTNDVFKAVEFWTKAADQGNSTAQFKLGCLFSIGKGVPQDYSKSFEWFKKAAEQGSRAAQQSLGTSYYRGEGVAENKSEAIKWFRKAAEQGLAVAQNNLGLCYYYGTGVAENKSEAIKWFRKAANQGYTNAKSMLRTIGEAPAQVKAASVKICSAEGSLTMGVMNFSSSMQPSPASPCVWIIRSIEPSELERTKELGIEVGKAYLATEKGGSIHLEFLEAIDLSKSDKEIAAEFGVTN